MAKTYEHDQHDQHARADVVFKLMESGENAHVLVQVREISKQSEAIRKLEEITREIDSPYVGSYLSA